MKKPTPKTIIIALVVLLILAIGYIAVDKYLVFRQNERVSLFQQGAQAGYEQAVIQLMEQAATCQQIPLNAYNQTMNIIAVECLAQE